MKPTGRRVLKTVKDYCYVTAGTCCLVFSSFFFILPCNLVSGGVGGISNILFYWFGFPVSITSILLQIPLLVAALIMLPKGFSFRTAFACALYSLLFSAMEKFVVAPEPSSRLLWLVFGGFVDGIGIYLAYIGNGSNGGSEIVSSIVVSRNPDAKIGTVLNIFNFTVYAVAFVCFVSLGIKAGTTNAEYLLECVIRIIYSVLMSYVASFVVDLCSQGLDPLLKYYIVTEKPEEVSEMLMKKFKRGVTCADIVDEDGLPTTKHMLIVVILNRQNGKLKHFLKLIDPECFAYCKIIDGVVTRPDFKSVKSK